MRTQLAVCARGSRTQTLSARERPRAGLRGARAQLAKGAFDAALDVRIAHHQHARLVAAHQHHLHRPVTRCRWQSVLQTTQHTGGAYLLASAQAVRQTLARSSGDSLAVCGGAHLRRHDGIQLGKRLDQKPWQGLQQPRPSSWGL